MIDIKDYSLKKKLIIMQLLTTLSVLVVFSVILIFNDLHVFRNSAINQLTLLAKIIGENSISALRFIDTKAAGEILSSLKIEEDITNAWIYDGKGDLFARYSREDYTDFSFPKEGGSYKYNKGFITVSEEIIQDNDVIGSVYIRSNIKQFKSTFKKNIIVAVLVFFLAMTIALFLSILMQKIISNPITYLVETVRNITQTKDYSIRIKKQSRDELGILSDSFNDMIAKIQKHNLFLQKAHNELEKRVEERTKELSQANIQLQQADRLKSVFLANMSHELRTPLNSIIGFTGMMLMGMAGDITEEQKKQLTMVRNSGQHLLNLINDILDISKIEADKIDILPEEFYMDDVVQEVIDTVTPWVDRKGIELIEEISEKIMIFSDRRWIKQILMNLTSNAVKFTDIGSVKIESKVLNDGQFEVRVFDTGIGIKKEDMSKLFGFFQQVDMSSTKKHEGTGLGLYLSKKLVTLLGGDISVKSEYSIGSTFKFTLPLRYDGLTKASNQ